MNPFDVGIVGSDCFHAVMEKGIARKRSRKVNGRERLFFYNPMWGRMGDSSVGPTGTYYYSKSQRVTYFWNTFDQILLRPNLLNYFDDENLIVISEISGRDLLAKDGISKEFSDHLPILIKLQLEVV
jgi:hypothetical protein